MVAMAAMNSLKALTIALALLLLSGGTPARAQSSPLSAIEKSVAGREQGWRLKRWRITRDNKIALYCWASGKSEAHAVVELLQTPEEAARLFKERLGGWAAEEVGVRMLNRGVPGLGDESSLIEYKDTGRRGVVFRKHRMIVRVIASPPEVAERFATYIADAIPAA
jgi:hypothetical protein